MPVQRSRVVQQAETVSELAAALDTSEHIANNILNVLRYRTGISEHSVDTVVRAEGWFADREDINGQPTHFFCMHTFEDYSEKAYKAEGVTKLVDNVVAQYGETVDPGDASLAIEIVDKAEELEADVVSGECWLPKSGVETAARWTGE